MSKHKSKRWFIYDSHASVVSTQTYETAEQAREAIDKGAVNWDVIENGYLTVDSFEV
jgi:hypothetical protein